MSMILLHNNFTEVDLVKDRKAKRFVTRSMK